MKEVLIYKYDNNSQHFVPSLFFLGFSSVFIIFLLKSDINIMSKIYICVLPVLFFLIGVLMITQSVKAIYKNATNKNGVLLSLEYGKLIFNERANLKYEIDLQNVVSVEHERDKIIKNGKNQYSENGTLRIILNENEDLPKIEIYVKNPNLIAEKIISVKQGTYNYGVA